MNATSIGMGEVDPTSTVTPFDPALVRPGMVVADVVVHPLETPILRMAQARGAVVVDGAGMLVHQAALAFRHWTGYDAPLAAMHAAIRRQPPG